MGVQVGRYWSVKLGTSLIGYMNQVSMDGVQVDIMESTAFGDVWKQFENGLLDGGQITFSGFFDPTDTQQAALKTYNEAGTHVTSLRVYFNSTSYFIPTTTGPASYVLISSYNVGAAHNGLGTISFTAKVSGKMEIL